MGDGNDGAAAQAQVAGEPQAQGDQAAQAAVTAVSQGAGTTGDSSGAVERAQKDYEAALKERDARIAELEGEIAEAAKTAEGAERLRAEMDELRRRGDEERVGFELQLAGARNVKAARALLGDYDNDIEKLRAAEPWLFGTAAGSVEHTGATGLPNAGAASDEGKTLKRWRSIAGLPEREE